jgi:UDP-2,3-diacylglucosamine pyrophosphatase LpxH
MRRIFVISDLHLGADLNPSPGQHRIGIFSLHKQLAGFLQWITDQIDSPAGQEIELVINGDFVDFLITDSTRDSAMSMPTWNLDSEAVVLTALQRIAECNSIVFEGIGNLLASGGKVTLLLGNHDIELSLPRVRAFLLTLLGGSASNFRFLYDGEAYQVGSVLIEHGNRYDTFNQVDYDGLRRVRSLMSRCSPSQNPHQAISSFTVPPGTRMVQAVINPLKQRYRFIDLLKPETAAVLPLILALEPDLVEIAEMLIKAAALAAKRRRMSTPSVPGDLGFLGATPNPVAGNLGALFDALLPADDRDFFAQFSSPAGSTLSAGDSEQSVWRGVCDHGLPESETSFSNWLRNLLPNPSFRLRQLQAALRCLNRNNATFGVGTDDGEYCAAAASLAESGGFDVVIFGHTHLAKYLQRRKGTREVTSLYINTGCWCDLMLFPSHLIAEGASFTDFESWVQRLATNVIDDFIIPRPTYAELVWGGHDSRVEAHLWAYDGSGRERASLGTAA